ncbi:MAG: DUF4262 domain-containing protein [Xanthomonadales bacterium]|nr:DUF4262 domain-containing protein [Xanthomonadales bacterium]
MSVDTPIAANIRSHGWHCVMVAPEAEGEEAFAYTIGLAERFDQPEVLVFGLPEASAHALLARCVGLAEAGQRLAAAERDDLLGGGFKVRLVPLRADRYDEYLGTAFRHYAERPFQALVLFWPDREGRFPGEPGYAGTGQHEALAAV